MHVFRILGLALTGFLLAFAAAALFLFSLFEAPKLIAGWIPGSAADKIGLQGIALLTPLTPECKEGKGVAALQRILDRLQSGADYGRPFKLHLIQGEMENAFALPGRHIVLVSRLVKAAKQPEEIAGVLAHEMGHGLKKDPEALFVRNIGVKLVFRLLTFGDQSALDFRTMLSQLHYSQEAERLADEQAIGILRRARISPKPAGDFILRSAHDSPTGEGVMDDFGSHLSGDTRAKLFLSQPAYPVEPILSEQEWAAAQAVCSPNEAHIEKAAER